MITNSLTVDKLNIAVLIPCYNEEPAIRMVVESFKDALPHAKIYVYDNNSTDNTIEVAKKSGAIVSTEPLQGKGNVVRRMFSDIEADYYIIVDGDNTYDSKSATHLLSYTIDNNLDMLNAARNSVESSTYRVGHRFGNIILSKLVANIFGNRFKDMLSGYKVFSRRFVKSFPALSSGFEIETELTIHALELKMLVGEIETPYRGRPEGSESKLRTFRDGLKILKMISLLVKEERPLQFFASLFVMLAVTSVILIWPIFLEYIDTGLVPRFPTAILSSALMLLGFLSLTAGLILDSVTHSRRELKRMWYLSIPTNRRN